MRPYNYGFNRINEETGMIYQASMLEENIY